MDFFHQHSETIDLLISDISLPYRNGVELAKALLKEKPGLKVLLISGWVGAEIMQVHGIPSADRHFLPKPFTASALLTRVREILANGDAWEWLDPFRKDDRERRPNGP
jgi:DNA-binding response OmpR family regulator